MLKIGVLVSGSGSNLQAIIDQVDNGILKGIVDIKVVISNKADVYALERASNHNIKTEVILRKEYDSKENFNKALHDLINSYDLDLIVLAGCLLIIPEEIIKKYKNRIINIHPSLIPSFSGDGFYGLKVHEEVLKRGVKITGATVHFVDEGVDTGPIIIQKAVSVKDDDTSVILQQRVMEESEWIILPRAIKMIASNEIVVEDNIVIKVK